MNKKGFQNEVEVTKNLVDKKLHFAKNTCKSLINLFENLANNEDNYLNTLKKLMNTSDLRTSLSDSKENDQGRIIRAMIDTSLAAMLQIAENHAKIRDSIRNTYLKNFKELLEALRQNKKQYLKELDTDIKKTVEKTNEKIKLDETNFLTLEKKMSSSSQKGNTSETETMKKKLSDLRNSIDKQKTDMLSVETISKMKLLDIISKLEEIEFTRIRIIKENLWNHSKTMHEVSINNEQVYSRLSGGLSKLSIEPEFDDYLKVRKIIDPTQELSQPYQQNSQNSTTAREPEIEKKRGTLDFTRSDSISKPNPLLIQQIEKENQQRAPSAQANQRVVDQNQAPKQNPVPQQSQPPKQNPQQQQVNKQHQGQQQLAVPQIQIRAPNSDPVMDYYEQRALGVSVSNTQTIMYARSMDSEFDYNKSLFLEDTPRYTDVITRYEPRYYNAIMYMLLSMYVNLDNFDKDLSSEKNCLVIFKNNLRLTLREVKIIETVFKITLKNKMDYKNQAVRAKALIDIVTQSLARFVSKKKFTKKFKKKEDIDYSMNLIKHLFVLLGQNALWQTNSQFKLKVSMPYNPLELDSQYELLLKFFFKPLPADYADYDFQAELEPLLKNSLISKPRIRISFPINMQISESLLVCLIERREPNQLFVDGWESVYIHYFSFCNICLGVQEEILIMILFKEIFERQIKPNITQKDNSVPKYIASCRPLLARLMSNIRKFEFEQDDLEQNIVKVDDDGDSLNNTVNSFVKYMLSKKIWLSSVKIFENFKKFIPRDKNVVLGMVEFAYSSFCYQKENLKVKDFILTLSSALAVCGFNISKLYQLQQKKNVQDMSSEDRPATMEFKGILDGLEKEIKDMNEGLLSLLIGAVSETIEKPPKSFEEKIRSSFAQGLMTTIGNELKSRISEGNHKELEEDITIIADQLSKIDMLLVSYGVKNSNYIDICAESLEKWFHNLRAQSMQIANQVIANETWEIPKDKTMSHTSCPLDLCYMLFNPVEIFKKMVAGLFKDKMIKKFEMVVFEILSQYFEHLDNSLLVLVQSLPPIDFKKFKSSPQKKKNVKVNEDDFNKLDEKNKIDSMTKEISRLLLRLGNLQFIHNQVKSSSEALFGNNPNFLTAIPDFVATYIKRLSKKISKIVQALYFREYFFNFLYLNFEDKALVSAKSVEAFQDDYQFSGKNLLGNLVPIMKIMKQKTPNGYFLRLLVELTEPFLYEYVFHFVDPEKAPRVSHDKYKQFLSIEIDSFMEFFFPVSSGYMNMVSSQDIKEKFTDAYKIASFFNLSSQELIEEYKKLDPLDEMNRIKIKVIPRILTLRSDKDSVADKFVSQYKKLLK